MAMVGIKSCLSLRRPRWRRIVCYETSLTMGVCSVLRHDIGHAILFGPPSLCALGLKGGILVEVLLQHVSRAGRF